MRARLYEAYAYQHAGQRSARATQIIYRWDIRPLLPPPSGRSGDGHRLPVRRLVRCPSHSL
jgi:hypothetical protein